MNFDENGFLKPYSIIEITLSEFEYFFVKTLPDQPHRTQLFNGYLKFIAEQKRVFGSKFFHWMDGSFITRKEFPNDLDVVTFLSYELMNKHLPKIYDWRQSGKSRFFVDAKFSPTCKWNHRFFEESKEQEAYWKNLYGFSRLDLNNQRHPKGIIKIKF